MATSRGCEAGRLRLRYKGPREVKNQSRPPIYRTSLRDQSPLLTDAVDEAIDPIPIQPVGFHRYRIKAALIDQSLGDQ